MIWYLQVAALSLLGTGLLAAAFAQVIRHIRLRHGGRRVIAVVDSVTREDWGDSERYLTTVRYTDADGILRSKQVEDSNGPFEVGATLTVYSRDDDAKYVLVGYPGLTGLLFLGCGGFGIAFIYAAATW